MTAVEVERTLDDRRPDILVTGSPFNVAIEIVVTHDLDRPKLDRFLANGVGVLRIRLAATLAPETFLQLNDRILDVVHRAGDPLVLGGRDRLLRLVGVSGEWALPYSQRPQWEHVCPLPISRWPKAHQSDLEERAAIMSEGCRVTQEEGLRLAETFMRADSLV